MGCQGVRNLNCYHALQIDDGLAGDCHPAAAVLAKQFAAPGRNLTGVKSAFSQFVFPVWNQSAMGRAGDRIFVDPELGGKKPGDEIDLIAFGSEASI